MKFRTTHIISILIFALSFICNKNVFGQTKSNSNTKTQVKSKRPTKTKSTVKSKSSKKGVKSKPLKYIGKEAKKAVNDVKKEL